MRPKRAAELVGGQLYWIIKHRLVAGTEIRASRTARTAIDIVCSAELIAVSPMPRRAHQGWRYLEDSDAPSADDDGTGLGPFRRDFTAGLPSLALV